MKTLTRRLTVVLAAISLGAIWVPAAFASCANPTNEAHVAPQAWSGRGELAPSLLLASEEGGGPTMVGLWHVAFIAEGNGPGLPPDGVQVDNALSAWHSDGTEETVSSRAPSTGDVCMGVWKQVGDRHYKLNHFGISFDPTVDPNTPQGFADIRMDITLSPDGSVFTGTFTLQQYDNSGNLLVEIKGDLVGQRVTLGTTVANLLGS
ncbi:hypothetical protein DYQ86_23505 [Acidobacteria bacterium AB60]|nr:hypothetical protein DYQ86_23505 [Acidobacteria bacterium AB60]